MDTLMTVSAFHHCPVPRALHRQAVRALFSGVAVSTVASSTLRRYFGCLVNRRFFGQRREAVVAVSRAVLASFR